MSTHHCVPLYEKAPHHHNRPLPLISVLLPCRSYIRLLQHGCNSDIYAYVPIPPMMSKYRHQEDGFNTIQK